MTDSTPDLSSLTEEQQLALQQYTSVTDQDIQAAISQLQKCQWNAQIAITRFFDGDSETVDIAAETARAVPPPTERRQENLQDSFDSGFTRPRDHGRFEPAPRVVATPESQQTQPLPLVLALVLAPFRVSYNILSAVFGALGWAFPILPRLLSRLAPSPSSSARYTGRKPLNPRDTAARFIREFEEDYGTAALPFVESGYAQAHDAAKRDLKYLLVVLLAPEHDDTAPFCRDTLLAPAFTAFLQAHADEVLLWGGSVRDAEAYQVAGALNVTKFPFAGLVVHTPQVSSTAMSLVCRAAGPTPPGELVEKMEKSMREMERELGTVRATRREQQASRDILQEQNSAYERSLAADRERARRRREQEAERERAEREVRERAEARETRARKLEQWRRWRAQSLPAEPGSEVKDVVRISVRMPSGERVIRKFGPDAELEELYAFVECHDVLQEQLQEKEVSEPEAFDHQYGFQLVSPMPREVYDLEKGGSIRSRIGRSGNLIVEKTDLDSEDEGDEDGVVV